MGCREFLKCILQILGLWAYANKSTFQNLRQFLGDARNIFSVGTVGTPSSLVTGSIVGICKIENQDYKNRAAILTFELKDILGSSLTRNLITRNSLIKDNPKLKNGRTIFKNVYLNWTWSKKVSY